MDEENEYMPCPSCGQVNSFYMVMVSTEPVNVRRDGEYEWPDCNEPQHAYALACDCGWRMGAEDPPDPGVDFAKELVKEHANKVRELFLKELETDDA